METASDKIKTFNSILESFLAQTSSLVGTTYHHYFLKLIKINAPVPINFAIKHLLIYKEKILNKDESYFTNKDVSEFAQVTDNILGEILRLKDIYYKLDEDSKENVWSILQALLQLTIEYCEIKNIKY